MNGKKRDPEKEFKRITAELRQEFERHAYLKEYGGQDPFWPDGINMNLVRNHIIYEKMQIAELCNQNGFDLPGEYFIQTPEVVDDCYMANLNQEKRVERLQEMGNKLTTEKPKEYSLQTSFI